MTEQKQRHLPLYLYLKSLRISDYDLGLNPRGYVWSDQIMPRVFLAQRFAVDLSYDFGWHGWVYSPYLNADLCELADDLQTFGPDEYNKLRLRSSILFKLKRFSDLLFLSTTKRSAIDGLHPPCPEDVTSTAATVLFLQEAAYNQNDIVVFIREQKPQYIRSVQPAFDVLAILNNKMHKPKQLTNHQKRDTKTETTHE